MNLPHFRLFAVFCLAPLAVLADPAATLRSLQPAVDAMSGELIKERIAVLASDDFEGRGPGSAGEEKTVRYLADQLAAMDLQPGNPDGTWFQDVPILGIRSTTTASVRVGDTTLPLEHVNDLVAISRRAAPQVNVTDSEVVFVGYGVQAPEYGWDDYKGVDVRGKTVVMLINDPPVPDPADPAKLDDATFRGRAMTYYGRWTYKYEKASEMGAAACLIIHETIPAAYPWAVVVGSWGRENFDLRTADGNAGRVAVEAWLHLDAARRLFTAAGLDFTALKQAAASRAFHPVALPAQASFAVTNTVRDVASRNVVALLPGSDPKLREEYVVVTAHWDHLGRDPRRAGDQIFNGALDNASGTATVLEVARALRSLPVAPRRSVLFAFVTAEEQGLLGSQYYATHPLYPLARTLANVNMDGANPYGRTADLEVVGFGNTTIDDLGGVVAVAEGRALHPDSNPQFGGFYRSDHFEFAKVGVPAFYAKSGKDFLGRPAGWGQQRVEEFIAKDYHKVSDEVQADWSYDGMVQDGAFLMKIAYLIAEGDTWPEWRPGTEFKAARDALLRQP